MRPGAHKLRPAIQALFVLTGAALSLYIAIALFGFVRNSSAHYATFVLGVVLLAGLLNIRNLLDSRIAGRKEPFRAIKTVMAILGAAMAFVGAAYIRYHSTRLEMIQPFFEETDIAVGIIFTIGVLLVTWLQWGFLLTFIICLAIGYFFFGHLIDNVFFTHPPYRTSFVMNYIGLGTTQGFFWLAQLAADSIYFLLIYASLLTGIGVLQTALELGKLSGRKTAGGAAYPAIVGSGIVASVMGQAVSNVLLTGRFTIPMMKRHGYPASMAGAIEAVASAAGQIMPPILGLAGFLIASLLNMPYIQVAVAALIPALLYLIGVAVSVALYARNLHIPKLTEPYNREVVIKVLPTFILSFAVVLTLLLFYYSPSIAGLGGTAAVLCLVPFQGKYKPTAKHMMRALDEGLVMVTMLSLLIVAIGPLGQTMLTTNLSGRLGSLLVEVLPDAPLLMLAGAMVISLVLGMGLPTPVAYAVAALAVTPFLQQLGYQAFQAHFFVFYFAVFSTLTPPIAVGVLAAAKLAKSKFSHTVLDALKISLPTFVIPYVVVYRPELLLVEDWSWRTPLTFTAVIFLQLGITTMIFGSWSNRQPIVNRWWWGAVFLAAGGLVLNFG